MKKILFLFMMCALLPLTAGAQTPTDDTFTVSDLATNPAGTYFDVGVDGSRLYSAYNLDLFLPTGISVALDVNTKPKVQMLKTAAAVYPATVTPVWDDELEDYKDVTTYSHSLSCSQPTTNQLRVACHSNINEDFTKNSGKLFRVYVSIDNDALTSSFSPKPIVKLSGLNLTTSAAVKYVPADFACRPFTTGIPTSRTLPVNVSAANKVGTLILPFDAELPSGLKAYTCNSLDGDLLTLTPAASIEACTPYIVYAENGYSGNLSGTAELSDANNVTDIFADGYLTGVLTGTTVNTGYILQKQGSVPMFYDAEDVNFSLPAGRCYLTPPPSSVKAFAFNFDDAVGIAEQLSNCKLSNCQMFDLSGRKVLSPSRGIYIQGTRKVVVK
ncbi:MAG: hypothetical protein E7105_04650 [Prevotella sp.]|nr:hypothetical protein [Prevotella sp.]